MESGEDRYLSLSEADFRALIGSGGDLPRRLNILDATDLSLSLLSRSPATKVLDLHGTPVTNDGLAHLTGRDLEELTLTRTNVSDSGLEHLAKLTSLRSLWLGNTCVTDAGLIHLEGLEGLAMLDLYDTAVTISGVQGLATKLPGCNIVA